MIRKMWNESRALTLTTAILLVAFAASAIGLLLDPRIITGAPAWLKPAKFAISAAIFAATFAWLFQYLPMWPRLRRIAGWIFSVVLLLEIALIDVQAARGTMSHFNMGSTIDFVIFQIMGFSITALWGASVAVTYALFRQPFANRAWGWSLRLGALVYVVGASAGGFMLGPNAQQKAALRAHEKVSVIGGHTVGAPDGSEGVPGVGWSRHHGDLRIPHFFGMHALQILPILGWLIARSRRGTGLVFAAAASYVAFTGLLTWQALRGQSILEPDSTTLAAFAAWAACTAAAALWWGRKPAAFLDSLGEAMLPS